jgi:hypothetical protein
LGERVRRITSRKPVRATQRDPVSKMNTTMRYFISSTRGRGRERKRKRRKREGGDGGKRRKMKKEQEEVK